MSELTTKTIKAVEAYKDWCENQILKNKEHLISEKDEELFAARFKVSIEEFRSLKQQNNGI